MEDFARLAIDLGKNDDNTIVNAIGPETFTYKSLIETIGDSIGATKPIFRVSPSFGYAVSKVIGKLMKDMLITKDEITGLMNELLHVDTVPTGQIKLSQWVRNNKSSVGRKYSNELKRRINRNSR